VCRFFYQRRVRRLKEDLERVREWQEQLRVLKVARDQRRQCKAHKNSIAKQGVDHHPSTDSTTESTSAVTSLTWPWQ
jgi:hypothetical protein